MSTVSMKESLAMRLKLIGYWVTPAAIALETRAGWGDGLDPWGNRSCVWPAGRPDRDARGLPGILAHDPVLWKLLGGITLLAPRFPRLKEWAYAGIFFELTGALASGIVRGGDPSTVIWSPLILVALAIASWALRPSGRTLGVLFPTRSRA